MPTYEFACEKCGHSFSRTESIVAHERSKPKCPKCKSTKVVRVLSSFFAKTGRKS
jgi:putative FmdB family regulatory protein